MKKLLALFLMMLPLVANAATFWSFDWETLPALNANPTEGIAYQGNCFEKALGDPFTSVKLSTKYVRTGTYSARIYTDSKYANKDGHRSCSSNWKTETTTITVDGVTGTYYKHRLEPVFGQIGDSTNDFNRYQLGEERWFRYSFYLPSDEGTFNYWNTGPYASKGIMILQFMASNNPSNASDNSHELAFILSGGPKILIQNVYGTTGSNDEIPVNFGPFNVKKDGWNDVVVMHLPDHDSDGRLKVWLNCADWASCTPIVNRSGPTAIPRFLDRYWKGGNYETNVAVYDRAIAQYVDSHRMAKRDAETDAQMLALMADAFTGSSPPPPDPDPGTGDMVINNGTPVISNQDPINFTVNNATYIHNCTMGGATQSAALPVKFDFTTGKDGKFAGVDTTEFSSTGTVTCYDITYVGNPDVPNTSFAIPSLTAQANATVDHWGYTKSRRLTKTPSGTGVGYFTYGGTDTALRAVNGDWIGFDLNYSCAGTSCQNLLFDFHYPIPNTTPTVNKRIRFSGTAGALVWENTSDDEFGTSIEVVNYTMPDYVYRASVRWKANENAPQNYRVYAGWGSASGASLTLDMLEVIMRKNATTRVLTAPILYTTPDTTPPSVENCTMGNTLQGDGGYTAALQCTADEIGGTDYAMITTSDTSPDAAAVQAGTGAIWSSQKSADTTEIAFEASGMSYQDLWGWIVRCDAADNCSDVAGVTFSDGLAPGQVKKIKFSAAGDNKLQCYTEGALSDFSGDIDLSVISGDFLVREDNLRPNILAGFYGVTVTAGELTLLDADADYRDLNSLLLGAQGYNYYATSLDGACRWDNTLQVIAE